MVRSFYTRAFTDEVLGPIFVDVAKMDLDAHMPIMCDFWENILFQAGKYRGGMGAVHFHLHTKTPLRMMHFQRWLDYWEETVDELFVGERANIAKMHAGRVAGSFGLRFEQLSQNGQMAPGTR